MLDAIVIGAGVAGLSAARALVDAGARVRVLEARERIGGRVFTVHEDECPVAIELGAEFLHGEAKETVEIARSEALPIVDVVGQRWRAREGKLQPLPDFWHQLDLVMRKLNRRGNDKSFAAFLATKPGGARLASQRKLAEQFVQGFHAVDIESVSAHAMAEGGSPGEDRTEQRIARLPLGYSHIPATIAAGVEDSIQTKSVVVGIEWKRGSARIHLVRGKRRTQERARAVIITTPISVLQAGAIGFAPEPAVLKHLNGFGMGRVIRVSVLFREPIWLERDEDARRNITFLHTHDDYFPVWWTTNPVRTSMLVLWAGGPHADALAGLDRDAIVEVAIAAVARQLGTTVRHVRELFVDAWLHDWQVDPYSRGAYSYIRVGGTDAPKALKRSVQNTLFFAGEAISDEGRSGTVDGAIASGRRAAKQVLRSR